MVQQVEAPVRVFDGAVLTVRLPMAFRRPPRPSAAVDERDRARHDAVAAMSLRPAPLCAHFPQAA